MARLLAGKACHFLGSAGGCFRQGAGRRCLGTGRLGLGRRSLRPSGLGFRLGKAIVRGLVEREIHPRLDMKVEKRLESVAI
jgi:hypothetical protein